MNSKKFAQKFVETLNPMEAAVEAGIDDPYAAVLESEDLAAEISAEFERQGALWDLVPVSAIRTLLFKIAADGRQTAATRVRAAESILNSTWVTGKDDKVGDIVKFIQDM